MQNYRCSDLTTCILWCVLRMRRCESTRLSLCASEISHLPSTVMSLLKSVSDHLQNVSTLRRLLFAVKYLSRDLPNFWSIALEFATGHTSDADTAIVSALIENLESFDEKAFQNDEELTREIINWRSDGRPLGIVLISRKSQCVVCKSSLMLRKDRAASIVVYDDTLGPCPGSHFHKVCTRRSCSIRQYYGYHTATASTEPEIIYDDDWKENKYFVSSSVTAFSMQMLVQMDSQILIGQLSYMQIANIFNNIHHTIQGKSVSR